MSKIFLWRHGNTDSNRDGRIQGQTDVKLNQLGLEQAELAAPRLAALKPDLLISSDLGRAVQTATALTRLIGQTFERDPRLRERSFGPWETLTIDEVIQQFPEAHARFRAGEPLPADGLESIHDLGKRVAEAIRQAAEQVGTGTAVLATHGGAVKWGIGALLGWPDEITERLRGMDNCHWAELNLDERRGWVLVAYNAGV